MYLENLVVDAVQPQRLGRFWEAALGCERLTDEPGIYETRLTVPGGPVLDLCFQRVPAPPSGSSGSLRLDVSLVGAQGGSAEVERLLGLGAGHLDARRRDVAWSALADPEGNAFRVVEAGAAYAGTGPLAALSLHCADPDGDADFWSWLTGWETVGGRATPSLRHPSLRGPLLELCLEGAAKGPVKNRRHLDVRLEAGDDADDVAAGITERGGRELHPDWGDLPWRHFADPSGNELCVLPARPVEAP